jgi:acyl-CoA synthetase (AMP-forming)/AMP-acid ligase II
MIPSPITAAGALAGAAYLNARWSLAHDVLYFRLLGSTLLRLFLAGRADKLNVFYVLEQHAGDKSTASRPFMLFEGRTYSYAETYETVLRYGAWLRECCGVRQGEIVALDYRNSEAFVFLWFAIWAIGAKPAFINYHLQGAALAHCLRASTAKLVLADPRVAGAVTERVQQEVPGLRFVVFTPEVESEARGQEPVRYPDAVRSESDKFNMAVLIYTSGTTGMPKPAIVSWTKIYLGPNMVSKGTASGPNDIISIQYAIPKPRVERGSVRSFLQCMPLYHSAGSVLAVGCALFLGATIAIGRRFSTKSFRKEVRESKATVIQYVCKTCRYLTVAPPEFDPVTGENLDKKHCVRAAMGNGLRPDVWDRFMERFGIDVSAITSCSYEIIH